MMQVEFKLSEVDFLEWASREGIELSRGVRDLATVSRGSIRVSVGLGKGETRPHYTRGWVPSEVAIKLVSCVVD